MRVQNLFILLVVAFFHGCSYEDMNKSNAPYFEDPNLLPEGNKYNEIVENPFVKTSDEPISTFSIDADGASYANVRRYLNSGSIPPPDAVRVEELLNYFDFNYPKPNGEHPVAIDIEMASNPWNKNARLVRIGMKGKELSDDEIPPANFVFLIDVSGSMDSDDKLGLVKYGLKEMVNKLGKEDRVALVTYASNPRVVLKPTTCDKESEIFKAIDRLSSGGSTNGEGGIKKAYELSEENLLKGGNNRIILCTDGDFNVGISNQEELVKLIEEERDKGVFLTVVGVGHGNLMDGNMEQLANNGNGTYEYLDSKEQADRVFVEKMSRMIFVAKDVKVQVEFNPSIVESYRLIGYENRVLDNKDFEDDKKDAGELGMGQTITALYEVIMHEMMAKKEPSFQFSFRYKFPDNEQSQLLQLDYEDTGQDFQNAGEEFRFAAAVASWGMLLRESQYAGSSTYKKIRDWAQNAKSFNIDGSRTEFIDLVRKSEELSK